MSDLIDGLRPLLTLFVNKRRLSDTKQVVQEKM